MTQITVKSDGFIYHLTCKNETRPVLGPTAIPTYGKRFRGRIELRFHGKRTWKNFQPEVGIQGFRVIRVSYNPEEKTAEISTN